MRALSFIGFVGTLARYKDMGMPIITPSDTTRCQAITDIIASAALQEAAIAHILNAEGEKIQKYTCHAAHPTHEQLIAVNKSVREMVKAATVLELMIAEKLELFKDCLCEDCYD